MKINVQFNIDDVGQVDARDLRKLIAERDIIAFQRSSGWVKIGVAPVRGDGGEPYDGPERRNIIQKKPHETVIACQYCPLTSQQHRSDACTVDESEASL